MPQYLPFLSSKEPSSPREMRTAQVLEGRTLPTMPRKYSATARTERDVRTSSWLDVSASEPSEDVDLPTAVPPPPWSPASNHSRPGAPTPSTPVDEESYRQYLSPMASSYSSDSSSPSSPSNRPVGPASISRSVSEGVVYTHSFARPPKSTLHDGESLNLPALSSSASTFTRSSAYTSTGSALTSSDHDHLHDHIHVALPDEGHVGLGITSDTVVQLLEHDGSSSSQTMSSRALVDQTRWSGSYSSGLRSRSSSVGHTSSFRPHETSSISYDNSWQTVDERDEIGMSEDETDEEHMLALEQESDDDEDDERTSAVVIAEEGRGLIVHGEGLPIQQLSVGPGTTHLLIGSSDTPNSMPSFLTSTIPHISSTLLALDISANFLGALPPCLAGCASLEELNIASNPLRVLPVFLCELASLRVLIADSTGLSTLPSSLAELEKLHTLSIRRNKMYSLPSWLCLLPSLQTLCVDGNQFQGPWKALVEPLLTKIPTTPAYPPSTPMFPLPSATSPDPEDVDDGYSSSCSSPEAKSPPVNDEDHTVTPSNAPLFMRSPELPKMTSNHNAPPSHPKQNGSKIPPLARNRTTPNRAAYLSRSKSTAPTPDLDSRANTPTGNPREDGGELRKMKSAGDLRRGLGPKPTQAIPEALPPRPSLAHYATSASSSNLLNDSPQRPSMTKRYASLGISSALGNSLGQGGTTSSPRPALRQSLWDNISESDDEHPQEHTHTGSPPSKPDFRVPARTKDGKEKNSRWGFLKKMSMGKMRDSPSRTSPPAPRSRSNSRQKGAPSSSTIPQINMRFSTMGTLDALIPDPSPSLIISSSEATHDARLPAPHSPSLLSPPSPQPKAPKRRSFLPINGPMTIPIPDTSTFIPGVTAAGDHEDQDDISVALPSPEMEHFARREEERMRDAYMRALRSVMAYLKDMNDLGLSQQPLPNPMSIYGSEDGTTRSRRGTVTDSSRENSIASSDMSSQLRAADSMIRSGTSSQTMSVATNDSTGSEERKHKDDKGKRAMIVREIVETERTYVKGLQELVEIYVKPAHIPANLLSGVGSSKDSVVPAAERKVVFSGIDALFSFHKESFLPALEVAASPLMKPLPQLREADPDGQLSLTVAKAVGNMFLKHAAFMKMYSSYINNFDSSVQRIKYWTSDRPQTGTSSPSSTLSPSSSTAQLVGLGLSMSAISSPSMTAEASQSATGVPNLTTSQRKRIKTYLKRCRMNPRHSQLNLEGYLLLPVQRIPRYRMLLEELVRSTPPTYEYMDDPLDKALLEISSLANNMNEGKRESESRRKLVQWQVRIRGKFPSPLVQPHRRLIMDGPLRLTRIVRKAMVSFDAINAQGDACTVQVDCLDPELTPRSLIAILCNDLLVLCRDTSDGQDTNGFVDLWAVLRMQRLPQPASIVHGNALRLVDNKAILYFDAPSPSDALNWFRAINLHIPASKS